MSETLPDDLPEVAAAPVPVRRGRRRQLLSLALLVLLLVVGGLAFAGWQAWAGWGRLGDLPPAGGMPFLRAVELPVENFRQNDPRWGDDLLGPTPNSLGAEGCAVSSTAMVLHYYGLDTDPQRLNAFLKEHEGFTPQGWLYWEKAAELAPDRVRHVYEAPASYRLIDTNLLHSNPVIVKLRMPSGITHFVVVAGKRGYEYLIQDPGGGAGRGLYPLSELGSKILGLRFYQPLTDAAPRG